MSTEFITHSSAETIEVGKIIGKMLRGGDIIAFKGGLGAGKTTITHGIALGMGLRDDVSSPTFAIVNEYIGDKISLCHFDMYRISADELESIGFYDYLTDDRVLAIEWSENIAEELPEGVITIEILRTGENDRKIIVTGDERFDDIGA
mgnify:FL=1